MATVFNNNNNIMPLLYSKIRVLHFSGFSALVARY